MTAQAFGPPADWPDQDLIAFSTEFDSAMTLLAYRSGVFPMPLPDADFGGEMGWWSPLRRGVPTPKPRSRRLRSKISQKPPKNSLGNLQTKSPPFYLPKAVIFVVKLRSFTVFCFIKFRLRIKWWFVGFLITKPCLQYLLQLVAMWHQYMVAGGIGSGYAFLWPIRKLNNNPRIESNFFGAALNILAFRQRIAARQYHPFCSFVLPYIL